jgi:hypothetical protein
VLGKDIQPGHMRDYQNIEWDNGGVHINSSIPNHAFYLTAMELRGHAWEKAGRIWYAVLRDKLRARSTFNDAAGLTFQAAGELYGSGSLEQQAVRKGWVGVGLNVDESGSGQTDDESEGGNRRGPGCLMAIVPATIMGFIVFRGARKIMAARRSRSPIRRGWRK